MTAAELRRFAVARSLFAETTLPRAIERLGFVQADPIRAPARAQDLTLRQRVRGYRAGDLEREYARLAIEEDFFINYGFLPRRHVAWMHPRSYRRGWDAKTRRRAAQILELVQERGEVHPREVEARLRLGRVTNYWGGSSNATTHLLDEMQYRGLVRVARRDSGIRVYAARTLPPSEASKAARADTLFALAVDLYAPVPSVSLGPLASRLRWAAPQLSDEIPAALARARATLARAHVSCLDWCWPAGEDVSTDEAPDRVRLLAPFDPLVWDRRRFELLWGWAYRFEAYTPVRKRKLGYYALPLLWRDQIIGWGNLALTDGVLDPRIGYVAGRPPRDRAFSRELDAEIERVRTFLAPR